MHIKGLFDVDILYLFLDPHSYFKFYFLDVGLDLSSVLLGAKIGNNKLVSFLYVSYSGLV